MPIFPTLLHGGLWCLIGTEDADGRQSFKTQLQGGTTHNPTSHVSQNLSNVSPCFLLPSLSPSYLTPFLFIAVSFSFYLDPDIQEVLSMYVNISPVCRYSQKAMESPLPPSSLPSSQLHLTSSGCLGLGSTCDPEAKQIAVPKSQCPVNKRVETVQPC